MGGLKYSVGMWLGPQLHFSHTPRGWLSAWYLMMSKLQGLEAKPLISI